MHQTLRLGLISAGVLVAAQATAQVTFFEREDYRGPSFTPTGEVENLQRLGFNSRAASLVVRGERWERWQLCEEPRFRGRCVVLQPGEYASLAAMGLNDRVSSVRELGRDDGRNDGRNEGRNDSRNDSRIVFYEDESFQGRSLTADAPVEDFRRTGFNDRASSVVVSGGRWEACQDARYGGNCVVLRPGQYPSLAAMGMNDRISSARAVERGAAVDDRRYAPLPMVSRDYGRRDDERLFQANVTAVRAVVEDSGERCWVEPQQVPTERSTERNTERNANVPGALLGAVIGGILGHQVGGGTGKDVATGIGVLAGAAIGNNTGNNTGRGEASQQVVTTQNVQRCAYNPALNPARDPARNPGQTRPAYWDVTYNFRGQDYRVQMTQPPGRTITVNEQGEPRG